METKIKISVASMKLMFHPCDVDFIRNVCHAHCCDSTQNNNKMLVTISASEQHKLNKYDVKVVDNLLQPKDNHTGCPFKTNYLCDLHSSSDKPVGCILSPFALNKNKTLIIRNRYKNFKCFKAKGSVEVYKAFPKSLEMIFGRTLLDDIIIRLNGSEDNFEVEISPLIYELLIENENLKKTKI